MNADFEVFLDRIAKRLGTETGDCFALCDEIERLKQLEENMTRPKSLPPQRSVDRESVEALMEKGPLADAADALPPEAAAAFLRARKTDAVNCEVALERARQDRKWGQQDYDPITYLAILIEEVGELAQAALHARFGGPESANMRAEAIQVAAVAVAIVECLDRERWLWPESVGAGAAAISAACLRLAEGDQSGQPRARAGYPPAELSEHERGLPQVGVPNPTAHDLRGAARGLQSPPHSEGSSRPASGE